MQSKGPTVYTKSLDSGYGIDLSTADSLHKLGIHGVSEVTTLSSGPLKLKHLGDPKDNGSYEFPLHCHGENLLGGEELGSTLLAAAETNNYITASLQNGILTFTSRTSKVLLPVGRLRGASREIFTIMFKFSAPENTGSIISTAIAFTFSTSEIQNVSYTKSYSGETVQVLSSSNATRQLTNLTIASSTGKPRTIDLSTFGVFRGTVTANAFAPYWGEKTSFFLSEPLRSFSDAEDIAYPLQGYAMRYVRSAAYAPTSIESLSLGSSYPTYKLPLPEAFWEKDLRLDHFTRAESTNDLIANAFGYMRATDGKSILVTSAASYASKESFLNFFNSLSVSIDYKVSTPVIERFNPIRIATRAGRNYIDLMTEITPGIVDFTYK